MRQLLSVLILLILLQSNASGQFKSGHYYKKDGSKISGLIRFNYGGNALTDKSDGDCSISFKPDKKGEKVKLTTNDVSCFVIEKDSFAIIKNFRLNAFVTYPQDFAKVLECGKINLYLYYSLLPAGYVQLGNLDSTVTDWVVEKDGKADKLTKKIFKALMPLYLSDYPELLDRINNDELHYEDSEKIIKLYNEHWRNM